MTAFTPLSLRILDGIGLETDGGCWLWIKATTRGGYAHIKQPLSRKVARVARLVLEGKIGSLSPTLVACHSCDNPACVNPDHLFAGTQAMNVADCVKKGRRRSPLPNTKTAKISPEDRTRIRHLYERGIAQKTIAKRYKISQSRVSQIVRIGCQTKMYSRVRPIEVDADILRLYATGITQQQIAQRFSVGQSTVSRLIRHASNNKELL